MAPHVLLLASTQSGNGFEIYTMNTDGSDLTRLTNNMTDDVNPAWSPDGTHIAFQAYRDGNAEIYVMHSDGLGQINLTNNADYDGQPAWSPDGSRIAFISGYDLWVMNADGSNPLKLSQQYHCENPVWSPDGSKIAYNADDDLDNLCELWVMNADGSNQSQKVDLSGSSL